VQLSDTTTNSNGGTNPDGIVEITTADGDSFDFTPRNGGGFDPAPGLEDLRLERRPAGGFALSDHDGNVTVFAQAAGGGVFKPSEVRQPGSANTTSFTYESVGGVTRVKQVLAPTPAGVDCSGGLVMGCRALVFEYATSTTATGGTADQWGDYQGRLRRVLFTAYDLDTRAMKTDAVAQYAYDVAGRLRAEWDPRISPALKESYDYDDQGHLVKDTPPGEEAWSFSYGAIGGDANPGRLRSVSRPGPAGKAITTLVYGVKLSGSGAPYQMGASDVAAWAQTDVPADATAVFPPDQVPADPPSDFTRADVHYLDAQGREVNLASPGGRITTTEYDAHDNAVRELTAANRQRAQAAASSSQRARELDTQRTYNTEGTQLLDELGPLHAVKLGSGEVVQARSHTHSTYDEGAPGGGPYDLPTTVSDGAQVPGRSADADVRTTTTGYDGQDGLGWALRQATSQTVDPRGVNLVTRTLYEPATGQQIETRQPGNPAGGDAHASQSIYYTADASASDPACANHPEWAGMLCKTRRVAQPGTPGLPDLPVSTYTYTRLGLLATRTETVAGTTRTTSKGYDDAGRTVSEQVSGGDGTPLPPRQTTYDPATGRQATTSTADGTVRRTYDALGQLVQYIDADGNTSTTTYDLLGRPVTVDDGKGTQRFTYDPQTGQVAQVDDSAAGTFTAGYDADGNLVREDLPNGLQARTAIDETGAAVERRYDKVTNCTTDCTWLHFSDQRDPHQRVVSEDGTLGRQDYTYDGAGRLVQAKDTPAGRGCTVRDYRYDADSNRTAQTTHAPAAADAPCDPTSTGTTTRC
jgi:YD repeat-containing protein